MSFNLSAGQNILPLPSERTVTISKGALFGQYVEDFDNNDNPIWRPGFDNLGSAEKVELKLTPKKATVRNNTVGVSTPLATIVTGLDATMSIDLVQKTRLVKALEIMAADPGRLYTQTPVVAGAKLDLGLAIANLNYPFNLQNVKVTKVAIGTGTNDVAAVEVDANDFLVDRRRGWLWLGAIPEDAPENGHIIVTYSAQEITEDENVPQYGGMTGAGFRMRLFVEGSGVQGPQFSTRIWDMQFITESVVQLLNASDSDVDKVSLQADMFPVARDNYGKLLDPNDVYFKQIGYSKAALA